MQAVSASLQGGPTVQQRQCRVARKAHRAKHKAKTRKKARPLAGGKGRVAGNSMRVAKKARSGSMTKQKGAGRHHC